MVANIARVPVTPRQALLLGTPAAVGLIALIRPRVAGPPDVFDQMRAASGLWLALDLLLLPLLGLLALAGFTLMRGAPGRAAAISRWAFAVFGVFAVAATALLGLGTGLLARYGQGLPAGARVSVAGAIDALWQSRLALAVVLIGAAAWWLAVTAAAIAFTRPTISAQLVTMIAVLSAAVFLDGQVEGTGTRVWWLGLVAVVALFAYAAEPRALAALLAGAALLFSAGLALPYGLLGMLCLLAAVAVREVPAAAALLEPSRLPGRPRTARTTR